jgi:arylsulfatase
VGRPAKKGAYIDWDCLATFDLRQTDFAVEYIKKHAMDDKPFFRDVNFLEVHNLNKQSGAAIRPQVAPRTILGFDAGARLGRLNTLVIFTGDNGVQQNASPDAGTHPFHDEEAGWCVLGVAVRDERPKVVREGL